MKRSVPSAITLATLVTAVCFGSTGCQQARGFRGAGRPAPPTGYAAPSHTAPHPRAPQQMAPQQMAPQQMAPQQMAPQPQAAPSAGQATPAPSSPSPTGTNAQTSPAYGGSGTR